VAALAEQRLQLGVAGPGGCLRRRVALQQAQHAGRPQVVAGEVQRGGEGGQQVGPEAVEQAPLVAGGPLVVAGDDPQLGRRLPVGDEGPQHVVAVEGHVAEDAGVLAVVLLAGRAPAPGDQVGVHRDHRVA
jgi:hypothetical protein